MEQTLFGFPARLTLEVDGQDIDVTGTIRVEGSTTGRGIYIDHDALLRAIDVEREVRSRLARA